MDQYKKEVIGSLDGILDGRCGIMTNFDFKKVRKVMKKLKWEWHNAPFDSKIGAKVPSIELLEATAREQLTKGYAHFLTHDRVYSQSGSGGFEWSFTYYPETRVVTGTLKFVVSEWDCDSVGRC